MFRSVLAITIGLACFLAPLSSAPLSSWEGGVGDWVARNDVVLTTVASPLATEGSHLLMIDAPKPGWYDLMEWDASGDSPLRRALMKAAANGLENYLLEFDVLIDPDQLPPGLDWLRLELTIDSDEASGGGWSKKEVYEWTSDAPVPVRRVRWPLDRFKVATDSSWYYLALGIGYSNENDEPASFAIDNFRIVRTGGLENVVISSWEDDDTLHGWEANTFVRSASPSTDHATHGSKSLMLQYTSDDWQTMLSKPEVDVTSAMEKALFLAVDAFIPTETAPIDRFIVGFEEQSGKFQWGSFWIESNTGSLTYEKPFHRFDTAPVNFFISRDGPVDDLSLRTVFFDNFRLILPKDLPEVGTLEFTIVRPGTTAGTIELTWRSLPARTYAIDISNDLKAWTTATHSLASQGEHTTHSLSLPEGNHYMRVIVE